MLSEPGLSRLIGSLSLRSNVIRSLSALHSRPITCVSYPNKTNFTTLPKGPTRSKREFHHPT